jgi:nucleobase:cation symporter-1, NCS1 family
MMPWKLLADPSGYIFTGFSATARCWGRLAASSSPIIMCIAGAGTGPGGALSKRRRIPSHGRLQLAGLAALVIAILPNLPGFLVTIHAVPKENVAPIFMTIYSYAWFVGFAVAFVVYLLARYARKN